MRANNLIGPLSLLCLLLSSAAQGQVAHQQQMQIPESNPNSVHYHTRYLPALGVSNSANERLEDRFGAFAMSEGTGWSGWMIDAQTKMEAERNALEQCSKRGGGLTDCEIVISFQNQCASVVGSDQHSGFGRAGTLERARELATRRCEAIGPGCKVFREGCSYPAPSE